MTSVSDCAGFSPGLVLLGAKDRMVTSDVSLVVTAGVCESEGAEVAGGVLRVGFGAAGSCCVVDATACEGEGAVVVFTPDGVAEGAIVGGLETVMGAAEDAEARVEREWRIHRNVARTTTIAVTVTIDQGIPLSRLPANFFGAGRMSCTRGSCSSGSSSTCTGGSAFAGGLRDSATRSWLGAGVRESSGRTGSQTSWASICASRRQTR